VGGQLGEGTGEGEMSAWWGLFLVIFLLGFCVPFSDGDDVIMSPLVVVSTCVVLSTLAFVLSVSVLVLSKVGSVAVVVVVADSVAICEFTSESGDDGMEGGEWAVRFVVDGGDDVSAR